MHENRRRHLRIRSKIAVTASSEHNFFTGFTEDISEGGLFVSSHQLLPVGTKITLLLAAEPVLPAVEVTCIVRWLRDVNELTSDVTPGMGLQFESMPDGVEELILQYIRTQRDAMFVDMD